MAPALAPPPEHASFVALLDDASGVHPLPHALYLALVRGDGEAPAFAGRTMTLADWYVRLKEGEPDVLVNETYTPITFDDRGRADWASPLSASSGPRSGGGTPEQAWWPTRAQRDKLQAAVFAGMSAAPGAGVDGPDGGVRNWPV